MARFRLPETDRPLIVEGAGGLLVPLNESSFVIDLIADLASLSAHEAQAMYVDGYHLSEAGNRQVASEVLAGLESATRVAEALGLGVSLGADR